MECIEWTAVTVIIGPSREGYQKASERDIGLYSRFFRLLSGFTNTLPRGSAGGIKIDCGEQKIRCPPEHHDERGAGGKVER